MNNDFINISEIETHLYNVIRKHVCEHCYAGTLPATLTDDVMGMVVIDCANGIRDYNAYGSGMVNIYIYAQPVANQKNVAELANIERRFMRAIRYNMFDTEHYHVTYAYSNTDYDTTYNMHFYIKAINITIT